MNLDRLKKTTLLAAALWALAGSPGAQALLYNTSGGYRYSGGDRGYWGHDVWTYGSVRLQGGWYPITQLGYSQDLAYKWVVAPGVGLAKGFAGVGKARAAYTFYNGELRESLRGKAHSLEAGASRAFSRAASADLCYRMTNGDLFAGVNRELNAVGEVSSSALRHAVFHQAVLSGGLNLLGNRLLLDGSFSAGASSTGRAFAVQSLGLGFPVAGNLLVNAGLTLIESARSPARNYVSLGASYAFAGRIQR